MRRRAFFKSIFGAAIGIACVDATTLKSLASTTQPVNTAHFTELYAPGLRKIVVENYGVGFKVSKEAWANSLLLVNYEERMKQTAKALADAMNQKIYTPS